MNKIDEKEILIKSLGLLYGLKNKVITINESEQYLFCPRIIKELQEKKCDKNILNLIEYCCEIEDIESIIPEQYNNKLDEFIEENLRQLRVYNYELGKNITKNDSR